jgi:hypothetical protein
MATAGTATPLQYELSVIPALSPEIGASTGMARRRIRVEPRARVYSAYRGGRASREGHDFSRAALGGNRSGSSR